MIRRIIICVFCVIILPYSLNAAMCLAGYYLDTGGGCIGCIRGTYCPGDDKAYSCVDVTDIEPNQATSPENAHLHQIAIAGGGNQIRAYRFIINMHRVHRAPVVQSILPMPHAVLCILRPDIRHRRHHIITRIASHVQMRH